MRFLEDNPSTNEAVIWWDGGSSDWYSGVGKDYYLSGWGVNCLQLEVLDCLNCEGGGSNRLRIDSYISVGVELYLNRI
jgi:hypothetical protein